MPFIRETPKLYTRVIISTPSCIAQCRLDKRNRLYSGCTQIARIYTRGKQIYRRFMRDSHKPSVCFEFTRGSNGIEMETATLKTPDMVITLVRDILALARWLQHSQPA